VRLWCLGLDALMTANNLVTVGARMSHILQTLDTEGNQAASHPTPEKGNAATHEKSKEPILSLGDSGHSGVALGASCSHWVITEVVCGIGNDHHSRLSVQSRGWSRLSV